MTCEMTFSFLVPALQTFLGYYNVIIYIMVKAS